MAADFCTLNGLMITARVLLEGGSATRVAASSMQTCTTATVPTRSSPCSVSPACSARVGEHFHEPADAAPLPRRTAGTGGQLAGCDVLLYQAGADPHIDDPLGGWLTTGVLFVATTRYSSSAAATEFQWPGIWPAATKNPCARSSTFTTTHCAP